jgi:hypothetical protein
MRLDVAALRWENLRLRWSPQQIRRRHQRPCSRLVHAGVAGDDLHFAVCANQSRPASTTFASANQTRPAAVRSDDPSLVAVEANP